MPVLHRHIQIRCAVDTAAIRNATFKERDHLVIPVVAMVGDIVVNPLGSSGPEFVPSSVLSRLPVAWNGRAVLTNHPDMAGEGGGSANVPSILEQMQTGEVFNARWDGKRLLMEAWIDIGLATTMGGDALAIIERCQAGEPIEVSVGGYVELEGRVGTSPKGDPYEFVWLGVTPDHLAMLPMGLKGACSVAAGCGAPRLNAENKKEVNMDQKSLLSRVLAKLTFKPAQGDTGGESVDALKQGLYTTLYATEVGFDGVVDVYPETSTVVYCTHPDLAGPYLYFQRTYAKDGNKYTLGDDKEQVQFTMAYKPLAENVIIDGSAAPMSTIAAVLRAAECSCTAVNKEKKMSKVNELATRLIASARFAEEDREVLEKFSEARLQALNECLDAEAKVVDLAKLTEAQLQATAAGKTETVIVIEPVKAKTEAEWLAEAPVGVRALVANAQAQETAIRTSLITALGEGQKVYTVAQLTAKPTDDLRQLAKLLEINNAEVDYEGLGIHVDPIAPKSATPPRGYTLALDKQRGVVASKAN